VNSPHHSVVLEVAGMTCESCAAHVRGALEEAGARVISVDWRRGEARFEGPEGVDEAGLRARVVAAGYQPGRLNPDTEMEYADAPAPAGGGDVDYDLVVLGAGSAAFAAAIKGAEAGYRVALVEAGTLGGTCVNVGCVPSKALLRAGELYWAAGHHPFAGIPTSAGAVDLAALVAQKDELVGALRQEKYADLVDAYGFEVIPGRARFTGPDRLEVDGRPLTGRAYLIATGASPAVPPIPGLAEAGYLTSTSALALGTQPRRLGVIGAGFVGLELGQFFAHLGTEVTFFSRSPRIAAMEEPEISEALSDVLRSQGVTIHAPATVGAVEHDRSCEVRRIRAQVEARAVVVEVDEVLVATGRWPNTGELNLEAAGVEIDERGAVKVDDHLRTTNPRVYAAGDVTPSPQFVYVSAYEGALAAANALLGANQATDFTGLPRVTFTTPAIALAGLTEAQARAAGYQVRTAVLPLSAVPRALVNRDTHGVVKLVADEATDRLLGASILAEGAGDAIQAAVLAIRHGLTTAELAATFHPYLTMAEGLKLAAQTFRRDVHKLSCCAA
jgi:mercuric reductase